MSVLNSLPPAAVLILGAILLPILPRRGQPLAFLVFPVAAFALLLRLQPGTGLTVPFLSYELLITRVDQLSLAFGYVFTIMAFFGGIYGFALMGNGERVAALVYSGSALGVIFAGDFFTLLVFWEIMAISSVWLIWARQSERANKAGMRYLLVHLFGGSVLFAGILWHLEETGSLYFELLEGGPAAYLILFGFMVNGAVPPLHAWLSDSYPEATVTGSVLLSAFTTKAAVCVLARGFAGWELLMWAGVVMALYGVVFAVLENNIRRILAYHIISQVGYMVAGIGLGTEMAVSGSTAHAFAHILYKGLLFMGAGAVVHATGRSKLTELGGLARSMPIMVGLYMVGAFSISGLPLLSGFVSKSLVIHAAEVSHRETVALLLHLASVGTFLSVGLKLPYFTWFGRRAPGIQSTPAPRSMYVAAGLAAGVNLAIGIHPQLLYRVLPFAVDYHPYTPAHVIETIQLLGLTAVGFWLLLNKLLGSPTITLDVDWLYLRPAPVIRRFAVIAVNSFFGWSESLMLRMVRLLAWASRDPIGSCVTVSRWITQSGDLNRLKTSERNRFDPDRYRLPVGLVISVVFACFMFLLVANLLRIGFLSDP